MSVPTVTAAGNTIRCEWAEEQVRIDISRINTHSDGGVSGELQVSTSAPGVAPHLMHSRVNLLSASSKASAAKALANLYEADWAVMVEQACVLCLRHYRQGEPVEELEPSDAAPPEFLVWPIWPKNQPTLIFGLGGTFKSGLALLLAYIAQHPWEENPLGFRTGTERTKVLVLDWETDSSEYQYRLSCMQNGMELPYEPLLYRRCLVPLADDLQAVSNIVLREGIGAVIVDSAGAACGSDLYAPEGPMKLFGALRQLKTSALLLHHTAKGNGGAGKDKGATPFGSAYFINYSRSVWRLEKLQDAGQSNLALGLYHYKANASGLFRPIGLHVSFGDRATQITTGDTLADFPANASLKLRIVKALENGAMGLAELGMNLDATDSTLRKELSRLRSAGKVVKVGNQWALKTEDTEQEELPNTEATG